MKPVILEGSLITVSYTCTGHGSSVFTTLILLQYSCMFEPKLQGYYSATRYAPSHCRFEPKPLSTLPIYLRKSLPARLYREELCSHKTNSRLLVRKTDSVPNFLFFITCKLIKGHFALISWTIILNCIFRVSLTSYSNFVDSYKCHVQCHYNE